MEKNLQLSVVKFVIETISTCLGYAKLKIEQKDVILSCIREGRFRSVTNLLQKDFVLLLFTSDI